MINKAPGGMIPFSTHSYFNNLEHYNLAWWPVVVAACIASIAVTYLLLRRSQSADRWTVLLLAHSWIWIGAAYHIGFAARLNWGSWVFGALFILQGLLFAWTGIVRRNLHFSLSTNVIGIITALCLLYAVAIYPIVAASLEHTWPAVAIVGSSAAPTTIFTLALLLVSGPKSHIHLHIIPIIWAVIGGLAAWQLAIYEDVPMLALAAISVVVMIWKKITGQAAR